MNSEVESLKIIFANYCILSWSYFNILPLNAAFKQFLYFRFCKLLVASVEKKIAHFEPGSIDFIYSFLEVIAPGRVFRHNKKLVLNSYCSPWSFPGCPVNLDESIALAISQFLPAEIRVSNFWADCVARNPLVENFFLCPYDIIFSNDAATKIHRFYVARSNFFSRFLKKVGTFLCDLNSFLLVYQHHAHAMVIALKSKAGFESLSARSYLAHIPVSATTGWGIGDIITDYLVIRYYVPQALLMHCKNRRELNDLLHSLWNMSSDAEAS